MESLPSRKVAVIAGASAGFGSALCSQLLDSGYEVAALGRGDGLREFAAVLPQVWARALDLAEAEEVDRAFNLIERELGDVSCVIYNAARLQLSSALDVSLDEFEACHRANCRGAFVVCRRALPAMLQKKSGTILLTGATASLRGGKSSSAFASSKFALRGLAQALAREFSPSGVHVVHVVLDGLMWTSRTQGRFPQAKREACMLPDDVARAYLNLIAQPRSTWTHEIDLRPDVERF